MKVWRVIVSGIVQGVCYRQSIIDYLKKSHHKINGYTKNLSDGTVEIIATGDLKSLEELGKFCYKGSPMCKVDEVKIEKDYIIEEDFSDFKVRY